MKRPIGKLKLRKWSSLSSHDNGYACNGMIPFTIGAMNEVDPNNKFNIGK